MPDAEVTVVPRGYCKCGCGGKTNIASMTSRRKGHTKGQPVDYIAGHHSRRTPEDYIENPVTGCWEWQRSRVRGGYGRLQVGDKKVLAHRHYYEKYFGPIPAGLEVDHLCCNRACVNPGHMELVTHTENVRRGSHTKLNWELADQIRRLYRCGWKRKKLSEDFGVSVSCIDSVVNNKTWEAVA